MEGNLKRNKRNGDLLHISVVCSIKAPPGFETQGWIRIYRSPIYRSHSCRNLFCSRYRRSKKIGLCTLTTPNQASQKGQAISGRPTSENRTTADQLSGPGTERLFPFRRCYDNAPTAEEFLEAVVHILSEIPLKTLIVMFYQWMERLQACIDGSGKYME
jgi:hypothetical protein